MKIGDLRCESENIVIDEYIEFRESIKKTMEHPEWLGGFSKEDLVYLLNNDSKIWLYYIENELVCSMMSIPSTAKTLKKFEVALDYREVIDYGPMMVNIKYVGNNLQYQMLQILDLYSKNKGYKYALSTIHPDNYYSVNNLIKDNFRVIGQKELKRGTRNIYLKKLN